MSGDEIRQEVDKIESGQIITIGVFALLIFGAGIFWAVAIQRDSEGSVLTYTPEQVPVGKRDEIGMVYQPSFDRAFAAELLTTTQGRLDSVGWVDEKARRVHVPIERAIKDYVADAERNGGKL